MRITSAIKKNSFLPINHIALNSFTICENSIIDLINDLDEKEYDLNAVTRVFIFLIRYLKGNSGTVALVGDFSIKSILQKLKWGANAKSRFKKCLNALEKIGFLIQTVVNNNTIYLNINQSSTEKNKNTIGGKTMHVVGGQTMSGVGGHPPHPCNIYNKEEINIYKTSSLYFEEEEKKSTVENKSISENSKRLNEVDEILESYAKAFVPTGLKNDIPAKQRLNFRNEYLTSGKSKSSSIDAVNALKAHPYKSNKITSPMSIFQAEIMIKGGETKFFMSKAKAAVEDWKAEKLDIDIIKSFAINNSFDWANFKAYFKIE